MMTRLTSQTAFSEGRYTAVSIPAVSTDSFRDLRVWRVAMDLVVASYAHARRLPSFERHELGSQMRRAAVSITANIAEGNGRSSRREYLHHLSIAMGSLKELESHVLVAIRLCYLTPDEARSSLELCDQLGRMLTVLTRKLRERPARGE
jgi:four helix bundle protein